MNWDQVQGNWKQLKGKAQQAWGDFTDDELDVIEGKREELIGRLQSKGYTRKRPRRRQTAGSKSCDWVSLLGGVKLECWPSVRPSETRRAPQDPTGDRARDQCGTPSRERCSSAGLRIAQRNCDVPRPWPVSR
jgi:uncharacterized protein YjbJ (UPF0337 family)